MNEDDIMIEAAAQPPPEWLDDVLQMVATAVTYFQALPETAPVSPAFPEDCRAGAKVASALVRLRRQRERKGFLPLPLPEYLTHLADEAGVAFSPVLGWFGGSALAEMDAAAARTQALLAAAMGIDLDQTLVHFRLGFASAKQQPLTRALARKARNGGSSRSSSLEAWARLTGELESHLSLDDVGELHLLEAEIRKTYAEVRH